MNVTIMRGLPGSGKSTHVKTHHQEDSVVSSDHYFIGPDGSYRFDPLLIGKAHNECLQQFVDMLLVSEPNIVVDNTNITPSEIAPYHALANAFGYDVVIKYIYCDLPRALAHNTHKVPTNIMLDMNRRLLTEVLPPWWKQELIVPAGLFVPNEGINDDV